MGMNELAKDDKNVRNFACLNKVQKETGMQVRAGLHTDGDQSCAIVAQNAFSAKKHS